MGDAEGLWICRLQMRVFNQQERQQKMLSMKLAREYLSLAKLIRLPR